MSLTRPVLRYHGGKWRLAPWIISHFPAHRIYCEPYGGAGSVLLRKERSFAEVYNDVDDDVVNVFRVLRDPELAEELRLACEFTPFSRTVFRECYEPTDDAVERARRVIARSFMAHGSTSRKAHRTGFRAKSYRENSTGARDWAGWPGQVAHYVERLRGVTIENRDALEVIEQQDTAQTLFYVDPPYPFGVRTSARWESETTGGGRAYIHNLSDEEHSRLLTALKDVEGMVVLSGYACSLYDDAIRGWKRVKRAARADGGGERTEVLWISPRAEKLELFA